MPFFRLKLPLYQISSQSVHRLNPAKVNRQTDDTQTDRKTDRLSHLYVVLYMKGSRDFVTKTHLHGMHGRISVPIISSNRELYVTSYLHSKVKYQANRGCQTIHRLSLFAASSGHQPRSPRQPQLVKACIFYYN